MEGVEHGVARDTGWYDNACVMVVRRFAENVSRKRPTEVAQRMSLSLHYVLDRFHSMNHTARLDVNHPCVHQAACWASIQNYSLLIRGFLSSSMLG